MVSMFASCAVDRGFEPSSNVLPIDYNKIAGYLLQFSQEKEQRLVGSESGYRCFSELALYKSN